MIIILITIIYKQSTAKKKKSENLHQQKYRPLILYKANPACGAPCVYPKSGFYTPRSLSVLLLMLYG